MLKKKSDDHVASLGTKHFDSRNYVEAPERHECREDGRSH